MPVDYVNTPSGNKMIKSNDEGTQLVLTDDYTPDQNGTILSSRASRIYSFMYETSPGVYGQRAFCGPVNHTVLLARELRRYYLEKQNKNIQFITINYAIGGGHIDNIGTVPGGYFLGKGSFGHTKMIEAVQLAKDYATSVGKNIEIAFIHMLEGAWELLLSSTCTTSEEYRLLLKNFRFNVFSDTRSITGQSYIPRVFLTQEYITSTTEGPEITMQQIQYDGSDEDVLLIMPSYHLSTLQGFEHYETGSGIKLVSGLTEAIYNELNHTSSRVIPGSVVKIDNRTIKLTVLSKDDIVINTSKGTTVGHGFKHFDGTNYNLPASVSLLGKEITITTNEDITVNSQLAYMSAPPLNDARAGSFISTVSNNSYLGYGNEQYLMSFMKKIV